MHIHMHSYSHTVTYVTRADAGRSLEGGSKSYWSRVIGTALHLAYAMNHAGTRQFQFSPKSNRVSLRVDRSRGQIGGLRWTASHWRKFASCKLTTSVHRAVLAPYRTKGDRRIRRRTGNWGREYSSNSGLTGVFCSEEVTACGRL